MENEKKTCDQPICKLTTGLFFFWHLSRLHALSILQGNEKQAVNLTIYQRCCFKRSLSRDLLGISLFEKALFSRLILTAVSNGG